MNKLKNDIIKTIGNAFVYLNKIDEFDLIDTKLIIDALYNSKSSVAHEVRHLISNRISEKVVELMMNRQLNIILLQSVIKTVSIEPPYDTYPLLYDTWDKLKRQINDA